MSWLGWALVAAFGKALRAGWKGCEKVALTTEAQRLGRQHRAGKTCTPHSSWQAWYDATALFS